MIYLYVWQSNHYQHLKLQGRWFDYHAIYLKSYFKFCYKFIFEKFDEGSRKAYKNMPLHKLNISCYSAHFWKRLCCLLLCEFISPPSQQNSRRKSRLSYSTSQVRSHRRVPFLSTFVNDGRFGETIPASDHKRLMHIYMLQEYKLQHWYNSYNLLLKSKIKLFVLYEHSYYI